MQLTQNQINELAHYKDRLNNLAWMRLAIYMFEEVLRRIPEQEHHFGMFRYGLCNALALLGDELVSGHIRHGHKPQHILRKVGNVYPLVTILAMNWEHTRSPDHDDSYPVPDNLGYREWEGPNLEMRVSLINHCLTYLYEQEATLRT